ncbi:MAG: hypothetical protein IH987_11045 [Planctomycetes bacterium]|nr:hypothetical protein [Planctomycetota bacterium]
MTEHSDTLDEKVVALYVKECRRVSSPDFLIIPGIEFSCDNNLHLLGLGTRQYTNSKDPLQVSKFIQDNGGVAVMAHPKRYNYQLPPKLEMILNGIEVWNAGYDGRFVPNEHSMNLLKDFRKRNGSILAFGGQDLHWITNHSHVQLIVFCESLTETAIVKAIKRGNYMMIFSKIIIFSLVFTLLLKVTYAQSDTLALCEGGDPIPAGINKHLIFTLISH